MPLFLFIFHILLHTYIHLITFIQYIYPSPFAEASLHIVIACKLSGWKPPCGTEPRNELGLALQQADALPNVPRRTRLYQKCNKYVQTWYKATLKRKTSQ